MTNTNIRKRSNKFVRKVAAVVSQKDRQRSPLEIKQFERDFVAARLLFKIEDELRTSCNLGRRRYLELERKTLNDYFFPGNGRIAKSKALHFNILVAAAKAQQKSSHHMNSSELARCDEVRSVSQKKRTDTYGEFERKIIGGQKITLTIHKFMEGVKSLEYLKAIS